MAFNDREMRRHDKRVQDKAWMEDVIRRGRVISIALCSLGGEPYVVPMGYGYEDGVIYLHGAGSGLKNDLIAENPRVSFNVYVDAELFRHEIGSKFSMKYRSVTGFGDISEIMELSLKNYALAMIMRQYDGPHDDLTEENHSRVWVGKIDIREMSGKESGYRHVTEG
ncbi:MAG: pyridoxamine 5'-phosphate oxidase family protein [Synergistaceae bacterium]|nr:pyridoxamine 5'-phosphate oxidase family protein [Synergistaceae bacterium]